MAKVEVDESVFQQLQKGMALLEKLNGSPKARKHLERAVKEEFPTVETEEERAASLVKPYADKIEELEKKIGERFATEDEAKKKAAQEAADADLYGRFLRLKDNGYTDEGLEKIAGLMKDRHIADPEAAAALYDRLNPKPVQTQPSAWEPQSWNFHGEDPSGKVNVKELFSDPDNWADKEAARVINEMRNTAQIRAA